MRRAIGVGVVAAVLATCLSAASVAAPASRRFACSGGAAGGNGKIGGPNAPRVTAIRVGQHGSFDRFVLQFSGTKMPRYRVTHHATTFPREMGSVTVQGTSGLLIRIFPVNAMSFHRPTRLLPRFPILREARLVEYAEGHMNWGLGIRGTPCLRVAVFRSPTRLVVDVARS